MSLTTEREGELNAIADIMYGLSASQRDDYNGYYNPDIFLYGCDNLPSSSSEDIAGLASNTTGLDHEEIEFLATNLKTRLQVTHKLGIKPGANPGGSPTGSK